MLCRKVGHEVWYKLLIGVEERKEVVVGIGEIVGHDDEIILRGTINWTGFGPNGENWRHGGIADSLAVSVGGCRVGDRRPYGPSLSG